MKTAYFFIVLLLIPILTANGQLYHDFPPTSAFKYIFANSGNITAKNYTSKVTFIGSNLIITPDYAHNTITFTGTAAKGNGTVDSLTCSLGQFFNSYNNATHMFTCGTPTSGSGTTLDTIQNLTPAQAYIYKKNNTNTNFQFYGINGTNGITVSNGTTVLTIKGTVYQNNTGTNLGTSGIGFFSSMLGSVLQFLKLYVNYGMSLTSNSTNVILSLTFKTDTKTCSSGFFFTAFDNSTGVYTCTSPSFLSGTIFKSKTFTCSAGNAVTSFDNTTGTYTCSPFGSGSGTITGSQNIGKGTNSVGVLASATSTTVRGKNLTSTNTNCSTSGSNSTDINLNCINTSQITNLQNTGNNGLTIQVTRTNITNNNIRSIICGVGMICSTNATTIRVNNTGLISASGTTGNITVSGTNPITINTSWLVVVTNGLKQIFAKSLDFGNGFQDTFGNGSLVVRNPTASFGVSLSTSAQYKNATVTMPKILGIKDVYVLENSTGFLRANHEFCATCLLISQNGGGHSYTIQANNISKNQTLVLSNPTSSNTSPIIGLSGTNEFFSPSDPTGTTSTTGLMMGLGTTASVVPTGTGVINIFVTGDISNSGNGDGANVQIRFSAVADQVAPANGAALTGTACGKLVKYNAASTSTANIKVPFALLCQTTALTWPSSYWIDVGLAAVTGGTASIKDVNIMTFERP